MVFEKSLLQVRKIPAALTLLFTVAALALYLSARVSEEHYIGLGVLSLYMFLGALTSGAVWLTSIVIRRHTSPTRPANKP